MSDDSEPVGNNEKKKGGIANLKMFPKGVSGNPSGRPKGRTNFELACQEYLPEALERILQIMRSEDENAAVKALSLLCDRALGKARQQVDTNLTFADELLVALDAARARTQGR